jgi:hypothetical protein
MVLLILRDAFPTPNPHPSWWERTFGPRAASGVKLVGKLATIPAFVLGGHWFGSTMLKAVVNWAHVLPIYLSSVGVIFVLILIVPLVRLIIKIANMLR